MRVCRIANNKQREGERESGEGWDLLPWMEFGRNRRFNGIRTDNDTDFIN